MIKNVIFDIGNVLVTFDPYNYYKGIFHDDEKTKEICHSVFGHEAWLKYDQGILFLEDLYRIYHEQYPQYKEEIDIILKDWMKLMKPLPSSYACMRKLKQKGYHMYLLSNISQDSADYLKDTQPFFSYSDGAVLSYEEKILKPDRHLYEILLERYQLKAEECLFLDDHPINIETAKSLGMHGIVVKDPWHMEEAIREYLENVVC